MVDNKKLINYLLSGGIMFYVIEKKNIYKLKVIERYLDCPFCKGLITDREDEINLKHKGKINCYHCGIEIEIV